MISTLTLPRPQLAGAPPAAPAPPNPAAPAAAGDTFTRSQVALGTLASATFCAASSAVLCGVGAAVAAAVGAPFFSAGAVGAAVAGSALFGASLAALTLRKPLTGATADEAAGGRSGVQKNLPNLPRDSASMVLAEHAIAQGWKNAGQAADVKAAAKAGADGGERMGMILGHGAFRTTSVVLGVAAGLGIAASPWIGAPLGFAAGFGVSYLLDKPGHWLGTAAGRAIGSVAGRVAHNQQH